MNYCVSDYDWWRMICNSSIPGVGAAVGDRPAYDYFDDYIGR